MPARRTHPHRHQETRPVHNARPSGGFQKPGTRSKHPGWKSVHVCFDDTSRVAYIELLPDEKAATCVGFLERAIQWFADQAIIIERVMTDNGPGYRSDLWRDCCTTNGVRHIRTKPYRPQTNSKAELFTQTMLKEWAYAAVYQASLSHKTAISQLQQAT